MDYRLCSKCGQWHGLGDFCIDSMSRSIAAQIEGRSHCSSCESLLKQQTALREEIIRLKNEMYSEEDVIDLKTAIVAGQNVNKILREALSRYQEAVKWACEQEQAVRGILEDTVLGKYLNCTADELRRRAGAGE